MSRRNFNVNRTIFKQKWPLNPTQKQSSPSVYIPRIPVIIIINYKKIVPSKHVRILGVYMDCHISLHIDEMNRKVMGTLLFINRIKDHFDELTRIIVTEALV